MAFSLLALLDDITTVLDDVALMTKVAARKTAGVLGDDLALNAQQVSGVASERELPVVWAVAKGSLANKAVLIPLALVLSALAPALIQPLLMIGGGYLCYEGAEKIFHRLFHKPAADEEPKELQDLGGLSPAEFEKRKIKGAVRTDFVLSAEIIVISLGTVSAEATMILRAGVLITIGLLMTAGVYGLVAGIVKLDDLGFYFMKRGSAFFKSLGHGLVKATPLMMRGLTIVGTAAMFLVGGGILAHGLPFAHGLLESAADWPLAGLWSLVFNALVGLVAGALLLALISAGGALCKKRAKG